MSEAGIELPELPEVEQVRLSLLPVLTGRRVLSVTLRREDMLTPSSPRRGRARRLLAGTTVAELVRHGKQLALVSAEGPALVVQLGMSGQLFSVGRGERPPRSDHIHSLWRLEGGGRLLFRDPRRFGGLSSIADRESLDERWRQLGPDALSIRTDDLSRRLAGRGRPVKPALLDQAIVAGIGNIYADETLFRAGIRPDRPCRALKRDEIRRIASHTRAVLRRAIASGGSTIRDYADPRGRPGRFVMEHLVYGRGGESCAVCNGTLAQAMLGQRTTVYCPVCQV